MYRALYVGLALFFVFLYLLPLEVGTGHWPGPDLLLCLAFAWVLRRPSYVPVLLIALVMLAADFLFMRPPGLWAALTLMGAEFLRSREPTSRDMPFPIEWLMVAGVLFAMVLIYRVTLTVFIVDRASLGQFLLGQLSTLIAYPFVVFFTATVCGIHKITAAEAEEMRVTT